MTGEDITSLDDLYEDEDYDYVVDKRSSHRTVCRGNRPRAEVGLSSGESRRYG